MTAAALSRHLTLLRTAGLIARGDVDQDGRGRAYELRPAALDALAGWLRSTSWAAELSAASQRPQTRTLLGRMGEFLDAFAAADVTFFERHLAPDVVLVFPGMAHPVDKRGCLDSVRSHPPYSRHRILGEPVIRMLGAATTIITFSAEVATTADDTGRHVFITAVMAEGSPWQLSHLQWSDAAPPTHEREAN